MNIFHLILCEESRESTHGSKPRDSTSRGTVRVVSAQTLCCPKVRQHVVIEAITWNSQGGAVNFFIDFPSTMEMTWYKSSQLEPRGNS